MTNTHTSPNRPRPGIGAWRRAAVYGLGASGRAALALLRNRGIETLVWDDRPRDDFDRRLLARLESDPSLRLWLGEGDATATAERIVTTLDAVVVSPGVPTTRPLLLAARARGLPIVGEVELAFAALAGDATVIGITGSNGKSTTAALTGALLAASGRAVSVCGNFGPPFAEAVLESPRPQHVYVVELSSFQLESVDTFRPHAAALLNLSPDHLDRHGDAAAYQAAKTRIFARQKRRDLTVLNADDARLVDLVTPSHRRWFSRRRPVEDGCFVVGERVLEAVPGKPHRHLFARSDVMLSGSHNLENAMAAALLARSQTVSRAHIARALRAFRGLPHRLEVIAEVAGVRFFDDSKGTNVGATVASLEGFEPNSVHLILGGRAKGADFSVLADAVAAAACRVYLIGEAAAAIARALAGTGVALEHDARLARAVASAARQARPGESVVLSPACASFDQFSSFVERGRAFKRLVLALAAGETSEQRGPRAPGDGGEVERGT